MNASPATKAMTTDGASSSAHMLPALPPDVVARLDELVAVLRERMGDALAAVVVHGSAVRGAFDAGRSDVDVLIVLRDDGVDRLAAIGPALQVASASARIEAMILRLDEIDGASDVFPLLYDDIRARHVVVCGDDPFAGTTSHDTHRRLRIEQELREAAIRLRRVIATSTTRTLAAELHRKRKQLRSPLAALERLLGGTASDDVDGAWSALAARCDVDARALQAIDAAPINAARAMQTLLARAIVVVDRLGGAA